MKGSHVASLFFGSADSSPGVRLTLEGRRGFGVVEILVAAGLLMYACLALLTIYAGTSHQEVQTQNRTLAILIARSALDEMQDHPFGKAPPADWGFGATGTNTTWQTRPGAEVWIQSQPVSADFHVQRYLKNGSLIGRGSGPQWDLATVVVSWSEAAGGQVRLDYGEFTNVFFSDSNGKDTKHLVVQVPIWK